MAQEITTYIENLISRCLSLSDFAARSRTNREALRLQLREHFYFVVLETVVDNLTDAQIEDLKNTPVEGSGIEIKIEQFSSQIPFLSQEILKRLQDEFEFITSSSAIAPYVARA